MAKFLRAHLILVAFTFILFNTAKAQNCTINAGADRTICPGLPFKLIGFATGNFAQNAVWTQIGGPAVTISSTTIVSGEATAIVSGFAKDVVYTFRLSAKCTDGSPINADVAYKASKLTIADAGPDRAECPGTITMAANSAQPGETGVWSVVSGTLPVPSPSNSPTATVTLPVNQNVGVTVYRWTIKGGGCETSSEVQVRNLGGASSVTAVSPIAVSCYTLTASKVLEASFGGAGNGQQGTWSFLSGPSTPVFDDIHSNVARVSNLVAGVYKIRWTVVGQCTNGSADVTINVSAASQDVTYAGQPTTVYCDGRTNTILNGVIPAHADEVVEWTGNPNNPTLATISSPNTPSTGIGNLNGVDPYRFTYKISNKVTGCFTSGTYLIQYTTAPSVTLPSSPLILPCGETSVSIPYTVAGGNITQWALVSGPANSTLAINSQFNKYTVAAPDAQMIHGMDRIGTYVIRFRRFSNNASGGCNDAFADISIVVSKQPYSASAGTPQYLGCGTFSATLAGNAPQGNDAGFGQWSQVSGPSIATIANKNLNTSGISNLQSGVYTFRWIVSGGDNECGNSQSDVKVIVAAIPTIVEAGDPISTCFGTPVQLQANVPLPNEIGTWSVVSETPSTPASALVFSNRNDPRSTVSGLLAGKIYTLRWTISNSCETIFDDVTITTGNSVGPQQARAGADQCVAAGSTSFTMSGNLPGPDETGTWTLLPGAPNTPTFSNANNTTVSGAVNGTYQFEWKLERNSCNVTRDTVVITVSSPITQAVITGAPSQNVCGLADLTLIANQPGANETGRWTQVGGPGGGVINNPESYNAATVSGLMAGRYKFRWTISNGACAQSFAEITYNIGVAPTPANAGTNQSVCVDNTATTTFTTLAANAITVGTGLWSVESSPGTPVPVFTNASNPGTTVSGLKFGTYVLKWTSTNGSFCPASSSNVTLTVGQSAKAGADQTLCDVTTTVLAGNEGSTGTWTKVSGDAAATVTSNSNNTAIVTGLLPGPYTFKYTLTAGACGTPDDDVVVTVYGPPSVANAGTDQELCTSSGTSVALSAIVPTNGQGKWSIVEPLQTSATIGNVDAAATTLNNLNTPGIYLLRWSVTSAGCEGTKSSNDIVRIVVYAPPTTVVAMADQPSACKDGVVLTGTTPLEGLGTWAYVSGPRAPVIDAPNSPTTKISDLDVSTTPYVFSWTITNGPCAASTQNVSVTVKDVSPSIANAGADKTACTGSANGSVSLSATAASTGTGTWTLVSGPTIPTFTPDEHAANATVSDLSAGTYVLKWTVQTGSSCSTEDNVQIQIYDPPSPADAGPATASYCLYNPVQLAATAPASGTGTWIVVTKPTGAQDPVFSSVNAHNATVDGLIQGQYEFKWTISNGICTSTGDNIDHITVNIESCEIAIAKSAGTPVPQSDGSYNVTFTFKVKNTGTTALTTVQVQDDLTRTFPSPKTFTRVSLAGEAGSTLTINNAFNGGTDKNLLTAASSSLAVGKEETITLVVNVKFNN